MTGNKKCLIFLLVYFVLRSGNTEWRNRALHSATAAMVEEKARVVLARSERAALSQLLGDYRSRRLTIEELVASLADLLNTHEKLTLLTELRELVEGKDRAIFDDLVYRPRTSATLTRVRYDFRWQRILVCSSAESVLENFCTHVEKGMLVIIFREKETGHIRTWWWRLRSTTFRWVIFFYVLYSNTYLISDILVYTIILYLTLMYLLVPAYQYT